MLPRSYRRTGAELFKHLRVIFAVVMKFCSLLILTVSCLLLSSCEKGVEFKLDDVTPKLVVEATIENGQSPLVYLSKSQAYFSEIDFNTLANSFVRNAEVYISNGVRTHKLKEYAVPVTPGINFYYYSNDPGSPGTAFTGELNKQYTLRILSEGKEYTATTTIPDTTRHIDSLSWKPAPGSADPKDAVVMLTAKDRPGFGDYTRYFTKRNSEPFYPGINSVYDDQVIDGTGFTVQVDRGVARQSSSGSFKFFERGDTVTLKLCNIDKATFDFWRTMEFTYQSVGNPFSSPTKVLSNINGGALGYFGGYGAQYRTIVIPR